VCVCVCVRHKKGGSGIRKECEEDYKKRKIVECPVSRMMFTRNADMVRHKCMKRGRSQFVGREVPYSVQRVSDCLTASMS